MFFFTWPPGAAVGVPPASWTGLTSSWDTVGMLGHVFDHQPPLTRPLQAVDAACSTTIAWKYCQKSLKTRLVPRGRWRRRCVGVF